jgi:hypothetical protein
MMRKDAITPVGSNCRIGSTNVAKFDATVRQSPMKQQTPIDFEVSTSFLSQYNNNIS